MGKRLDGKVCVITGAASGIGKAGAFLFASEGAVVVVADLNISGGQAVRQELLALGHRALFLEVDVRDTSSVERMTALTVEEYGRIDVLFHNAMNCRLVNEQDKCLIDLPEAIWSEIQNLVLGGTYRCCKAIGKIMEQQRAGSIVLTATADALIGTAGYDAYTAAKGGVVSLTRSFAAGVGKFGIRVNTVCPGFVATEPQMEWLQKDQAKYTMGMLHLLPIARPEDIASLAMYLASDEASVITGGIYPVDSGYTAFKANLDVSGLLNTKS